MNSFCVQKTMNSDWAELPQHLLCLVLDKLGSQKDYLQFSVACTLWYHVMKEDQIKRTYMIKLSHQAPMLIVPNKEEYTWNTYDPMTNNFIESKLVIPYNKHFGGSSEGWLVTVNEDFTVTMYKPYSMVQKNAIIHLPYLFPPSMEDLEDLEIENPEIFFQEVINMCDYYVFKAIITADPLINPNDCIIVVIFSGKRELAYIRPAKDTTWTKIDLDEEYIFDVLFHDGKFYALNDQGELLSFDISDPCKSKIMLVKQKLPKGLFTIKPYLVKSHEGKIYRVDRYVRWDNDIATRVTIKVRIFILDFNEEESRWLELKSLGDIALFLGDNSSICVRASDFIGCKSNCIYFTHDFDTVSYGLNGPSDFGVYHLKDKSFEKLTLACTKNSAPVTRKAAQPPVWIVPTINLY